MAFARIARKRSIRAAQAAKYASVLAAIRAKTELSLPTVIWGFILATTYSSDIAKTARSGSMCNSDENQHATLRRALAFYAQNDVTTWAMLNDDGKVARDALDEIECASNGHLFSCHVYQCQGCTLPPGHCDCGLTKGDC